MSMDSCMTSRSFFAPPSFTAKKHMLGSVCNDGILQITGSSVTACQVSSRVFFTCITVTLSENACHLSISFHLKKTSDHGSRFTTILWRHMMSHNYSLVMCLTKKVNLLK
jgi:hypothetical protein